MKTYPYVERLYPNRPSAMDRWQYDSACELFVEGKVVEGIHAILDYYNPGVRLLCDDEKKGTGCPNWTMQPTGLLANFRRQFTKPVYGPGRKFTIPHGSLVLYLEISETEFQVRIPFVKLPQDQSLLIAFLRHVNSINAHLDWFQLVLREDELLCEYSCPLPVANPNKVRRILMEVCLFLSDRAEELVYKYGGSWVKEPHYLSCPPANVERAIQAYRGLCKWLRGLLKQDYLYMLLDYVNELFVISHLYVLFFMRADGYWEQRLTEIFCEIIHVDDDDLDRFEHLNQILSNLEAVTDDELRLYLHRKPRLISSNSQFSLKELQDSAREQIEKLQQSFPYRAEKALLSSLLFIFSHYATHDIPAQVDRIFDKMLRTVMGMDCLEVFPFLLKAFGDILALPVMKKEESQDLKQREEWG